MVVAGGLPDHYGALGAERGADEAAVKKSYRKQALGGQGESSKCNSAGYIMYSRFTTWRPSGRATASRRPSVCHLPNDVELMMSLITYVYIYIYIYT